MTQTHDHPALGRVERILLVALAVLLSTVSIQAQTYDMLDYMFHDNQKKANVLNLSGGGSQPIRAYSVGGNRFYITKQHPDGNGFASEYEEYTYDSNYIYLVRDTSWQPDNWCSGQQTSFELWTGGRNRGARFPRYVYDNQEVTPPAAIIKARKEGNGCGLCNAPKGDSDGQYVTSTYRFDHLSSKTFYTGQTVYDVIKVAIIGGVASEKNEVYYFSKSLGWVGFEDTDGWAHYSGPANGGNDFEVLAKDACPGATGCTWYQSQSGTVYHQTGEPDGYDWSANVWEHGAGYLAYGPYDPKWGIGWHNAYFYLMIDNNSADNAVVATIDVVTDQGRRVMARRDIRRTEFSSPYTWQFFSLSFFYPSFEETEVRIYWHDNAYIKHGGTYICK